ncbi:threonine/serine exporter family protein [Streptomyces tubbatahanensis]|uniref:Threonine/serine exporter family protein n=1 Tax=Streptomyces tubbatahanensis TaxID=2923272 RepID=A0ABY3XUR1_9ACTN|nr:threonine/serine exporter family protein [Streptomyces tubbatahanensis]UNS98219.1 threonine/serine exporter family protein [Streptomyces tubbatahanensis]
MVGQPKGNGDAAEQGGESEDARTSSDESRSAFTAPMGVPLPPVPEEEHPTSEFTLPEGLKASPHFEHGSAFTPPEGIPVVGPLAKPGSPWQDRMRSMVRMPLAERPVPEKPARTEETESGPPPPRVLDLTLRIGELLLAGGEGAEDVEAAMFGVAHAYGLDRTEPTVTFTLLSITHQPSLVDDPVTLSRTVRRRGTDYTRLSSVFGLVADITQGDVSLEEAYRRLAEMRRNRHPYTKWALSVASGALSGAASLLVGGDALVFFLAALGAVLGDRLAWLCAARGLPEFYQFAAAAMPPAGIGVGVALLSQHTDMDIQASAVITGGLFALIPGRALVAAVQDGLTGFYITAAARLLEVVYLIVGIVCGVLMILYVGDRLHAQLTPDVVYHADRPVTQLLAAMLLTLAFCILLQQERHTIVLATLNGGVAWLIFGALSTAGVKPVPATVMAAGLVGLFGQLLSRYQFASSLPYITAAIGPLLPGSNTYFGLLNIAQEDVNKGFEHLATAGALALAIAIGVNLGGELARLFIKTPGQETPLPGRRAAKRTRGF